MTGAGQQVRARTQDFSGGGALRICCTYSAAEHEVVGREGTSAGTTSASAAPHSAARAARPSQRPADRAAPACCWGGARERGLAGDTATRHRSAAGALLPEGGTFGPGIVGRDSGQLDSSATPWCSFCWKQRRTARARRSGLWREMDSSVLSGERELDSPRRCTLQPAGDVEYGWPPASDLLRDTSRPGVRQAEAS